LFGLINIRGIITLLRCINYFSLYFVKYTPHRKWLKKFVDLNEVYSLRLLLIFLCNKLFLRNLRQFDLRLIKKGL
jgi:hypothetical protein